MPTSPLEIIAGPIEAHLAPVGTTMPDVASTPAGNWVKLGTNGNKNQSEDGLAIVHEQDIEDVRVAGRTGPIKAYRTAEGLKVSFTLYDLSPEVYSRVLNGNTVTNVAAGSGTAGAQTIPLLRGLNVTEYALLVKGAFSSEGDGYSMQYQVPRCYLAGAPEVVFKKGEPAGLAFEFMALEDPDASAGQEFGKLVIQDAAAS